MNTKILLVDDEERILQTFARTLRLGGYAVITAASGSEGVTLYHQEQPDIVLLDLRMPGMDGLEVLQAIREDDPEANVILCTAHGDKDAVIEALRAGASDFLPKPVDQVTLESALRRAEERVQLKRKLRASQDALRQQNERLEEMVEARTAELEHEIEERKQAHSALQESKELFEKTFDSQRDAIFILDAQQPATIIDCNPAATRIFGYACDEMIGRTTTFLHVDEDTLHQFQNQLFSAIADQGYLHLPEFQMRRRDGTLFLTAHSVVPLENEEGERIGWVSTVRDVTERKQTTTALQESEAQYRRLLNALQEGVWAIDGDSRTTYVNPRMAEMLGYTEEEMLGRHLFDFMDEQGVNVARRLLARRRDGIEEQHEFQFVHKDGRHIYTLLESAPILDEAGTYCGAIAGLIDITERRRAREALRESEERYRLLAETTRDIIVLHDMEGRIRYVNQAGLDFAGFSASEALGQPIATFIPTDHLAEIETRRVQRASGDDQTYRYETEFVNRNGQRVPVEVHSTPILRQDHVREILLVARDIAEREYAKKAILAERERLDDILSALETGLSLINPDMTIAWVNRKIRDMFPDEDPIGETCHVFYESRDTPCGDCGTRLAFQTGEAQVRERRNPVDERWYTIISQPVRDEKGRVVNVLEGITDITERKLAEEALRKSQDLFVTVTEQSREGISVANLAGDYILVNSAFATMTGYSKEELLSMNVRDLLSPGVEMNPFSRAAAGGEGSRIVELQRKDGSTFYAEVNGNRIELEGEPLVLGIVRDVTERMRMEKALRENIALYDTLVANVPAGIYIVRILNDGSIDFEYVSDRWCEMHQLAREAVLDDASVANALVHPDEREVFLESNREAHLTHTPFSWTGRFIIGDETRWLQVKSTPTIMEDGNVRWFGVTTDITQLKQAEGRLKTYSEQLEDMVEEKMRELEEERAKAIQLDKLAALGEMAIGVIHELNQPLTAIRFEVDYLEMLRTRAQNEHAGDLNAVLDVESLEEVVGGLKKDLVRCRRLTDHLRDFGRISQDVPVFISLNRPIEDSFILVGTRLRDHNVEVRLNLADDLPPVLAHPHRLEQVFVNLIANAEYAMEERAAEEPGYQKVLEITTTTAGDEVVATVRDNGCGMPEEVCERIFDPFFTTKPEGEGTGLGLSISYGIVTSYDGEIACDSVEGQGTTFILRFPVAEGGRE